MIARPQSGPVVNAMTIDVEDYFQVSAFERHIQREDWDGRDCRIERNVERILGLLDQHRAKATFFTLGWIAERYPHVVRDIAARGHEVASHGYGHQRVTDLAESAFRVDVMRTKALLEDISGAPVTGYRAPSFSIGAGNLWALDCLADAGYRYSSSVYPIRHDHYGMPDAPRFAHRRDCGLTEIPVTTARVLNRNLPAGGGGYFRLLPYVVSRSMIRSVNARDREAAIFYFHPWEIDREQPRVAGIGAKTRFRHYVNLGRTERRLERLLHDFSWQRMDAVFADRIGAPDPR